MNNRLESECVSQEKNVVRKMPRRGKIGACNLTCLPIRWSFDRRAGNGNRYKGVKKGLLQFVLQSWFDGKNITHSSQAVAFTNQIV